MPLPGSRFAAALTLGLVVTGCASSTRPATPEPPAGATAADAVEGTTAKERVGIACGILRFHLPDGSSSSAKGFDHYTADLARELFISAVASSDDAVYAEMRRVSDGFVGKSPRRGTRKKVLDQCDRAGMTDPLAGYEEVRLLACRMASDLAANRPTLGDFAAGTEGHFFESEAASQEEPFAAHPRAISLALVMLPMHLDDDWSRIPQPGVELVVASEQTYIRSLASLRRSC